MNPGHAQAQNQSARFSTTTRAWPRAQDASFDSDTEQGYGSNSRSDSSSVSQSRGYRGEDGLHVSPSKESTPDPAPLIPFWSAKRHLTCGNPTPDPHWSSKNLSWRGAAPGKLKTASAALVICLGIGIGSPDVTQAKPCAVLECWIDPQTLPAHSALERIGSNLQRQFEGLSQKISYKPILDPSYDDLKRNCHALRKSAKDDAVLFYYNGHGVPKPSTTQLWCFNGDYTKFARITLHEVQGWLGSPGVYIWDCSGAGNILTGFNLSGQKRDQEAQLRGVQGYQPMMNSLQLAACGANETLPTSPKLPADLFTSCLTSPLEIALRFFAMNHQLPNNITADMVMQLPGDLKDRRTPLGELNWIFTAVTDTIAWTTFSPDIFTRLYRCDLLIASLFRNFLLAERIMKDYNCTPHTWPPLPATNTHPLWATWDLAVDTCLRQLPTLLGMVCDAGGLSIPLSATTASLLPPGTIVNTVAEDQSQAIGPYIPNRFFSDQLTAFEVWISRGGSALTKPGPRSLPTQATDSNRLEASVFNHAHSSEEHLVPRKPPDQLPIVLQVLLSQPHRLRALILLAQFVDLGPWAVHLVLTIGISPYISKLLQAAGPDLRPVLIFIWSRILAVDSSVQTDLYNSSGYRYFSNILGLRNEDQLPNSTEHKAMCSFILASVCRDFPHGQSACWNERVFDHCCDRLDGHDFLLRQWTALCISQIWNGHDEIKMYGVGRRTPAKLISMLSDDSAEVRAAALYALGTFMGASGSADPDKRGGGGTGMMNQFEERDHFRWEVSVVIGAALAIKEDASPMCRKELLVVISCLVAEWRGYFVVCAWLYWEEDRRWRSGSQGQHSASSSHYGEDDITNQAVEQWLETFGEDETLREENRVLLTSLFTIFVLLLDLSVDPYHEVATNAQTIVDYIMALLLQSPFARLEYPSPSLRGPSTTFLDKCGLPPLNSARARVSSVEFLPTHKKAPATTVKDQGRPSLSRTNSMASIIVDGVSNTFKRTPTFSNALKSLGGSIVLHASEDGRASPGLVSSIIPNTFRRDSKVTDVSRPPSPNMNVAQYSSPYFDGSGQDAELSVPSHSYTVQNPSVDFLPCDVIEALMEEDMERLRSRRRAWQRAQHRSLPKSPSNSTFSIDSSASSVILGLGTGTGIRNVLPLKSTFFDWCVEYFKEPQMRQAEADEPGSVQYSYQVWRQTRNDQLLKETESQAPLAESTRWDRPLGLLHVAGHPLTMTFHAYDSHLVLANEHDMISVWDWTTRKRLNYFCNGNPKGTSITAIEIINQDVGGIILSGSADGIIRLYRNYDPTLDQGPLQMVSAFRGLSEMVQSRQGTGLVMDWKQSAGILLLGGDSRAIKVWDAHTETQGFDMLTKTESPVTAIASDSGLSQTFLASFADGVVKVFDRRLDDDDAIVRTYADHSSWVQNVHWHPTSGGQFVSASVNGLIKLFDLRGADYASQTWNTHPQGLASFDVHPVSGVFGSNSSVIPTNWKRQRIHIQSLKQHMILTDFSVPTGLIMPPAREFPSAFIPRATSFVFHPTQMIYANGGADGCVRIMGCGSP